MKNQRVLAILLVFAFVIAVAPLCQAASLSKPNVTLPSGWELADETPYPNEVAEHDEGAGLLEYQNSETLDFVMIYYENAPSTSYTSPELKSEVESIFYRDHTDLTISQSGTTTYSGVQAGFAKAYDSTYDVYHLELVLVKGNYYMNIYAVYDTTDEAENAVESLINSINTDSGLGSMLYIIIGIVIVIIVVVVVIMLIMKRRKKTTNAQAPEYQASMPIPPPPPT